MYNPVEATREHAIALYEKHISKPAFFLNFSYDSEDEVGFFSFKTLTGKKVSGQLRRELVCFVEVTGFNTVRYDMSYPDELYKPLYSRLKELAKKAEKAFWNGSQI